MFLFIKINSKAFIFGLIINNRNFVIKSSVFSNIKACMYCKLKYVYKIFLDSLFQEISYDDFFTILHSIFLGIKLENSLLDVSFSNFKFMNISIINCSSNSLNLNLLIINYCTSVIESINFENCQTGFLDIRNSNITLINSLFTNNETSTKILKSLINTQKNSKNIFFTLLNCRFSFINSAESGAVFKNYFIIYNLF